MFRRFENHATDFACRKLVDFLLHLQNVIYDSVQISGDKNLVFYISFYYAIVCVTHSKWKAALNYLKYGSLTL